MAQKPLTFEQLRAGIIEVITGFPISKAAVFGSYARGDASKSSDLDLLVEPVQNTSLLRLIELQQALEDRLNISVDIVTYDSLLGSKMGTSILGEAKDVYGQN